MKLLSTLPPLVCAAALFAQETPSAANAAPAEARETVSLILVQGAPGEPEYGVKFTQQTAAWLKAAERWKTQVLAVIGGPSATGGAANAETDYQKLRETLAAAPKEGGPDALWIVFHGHGVWNGKEAFFNLQGPDVSASELAEWLKPFTRPVTVINTASSSAPFLQALGGPGRITITATRSGNERNFTRFGWYLAESLDDPEADLDQDGRVSLLELFLRASHRTVEFYQTEGRIVTEHALLDDNGDGLGTPADWFRGVRAVKKPANQTATADGFTAHRTGLQPEEGPALSPERRERRDALERELAELRERRDEFPEEEAYLRKLEDVLLRLAAAYAEEEAGGS